MEGAGVTTGTGEPLFGAMASEGPGRVGNSSPALLSSDPASTDRERCQIGHSAESRRACWWPVGRPRHLPLTYLAVDESSSPSSTSVS